MESKAIGIIPEDHEVKRSVAFGVLFISEILNLSPPKPSTD